MQLFNTTSKILPTGWAPYHAVTVRRATCYVHVCPIHLTNEIVEKYLSATTLSPPTSVDAVVYRRKVARVLIFAIVRNTT
jgi:hypothetical protein